MRRPSILPSSPGAAGNGGHADARDAHADVTLRGTASDSCSAPTNAPIGRGRAPAFHFASLDFEHHAIARWERLVAAS